MLMQLNKRKFVAIVTSSFSIGILFGISFMYQTSLRPMENKIDRYSNALRVSRDMTDNAYEAFYAISMCDTKAGCDFVLTVTSLNKLESERKTLNSNLEQLLQDL
jgi:hypothetical protein